LLKKCLTLYNSWGEIVFQTRDLNFGWDGTYGNQLAQKGTYVWIIEFIDAENNNFKQQINGSISLMR
jgi:gliding motility-associated-like protein